MPRSSNPDVPILVVIAAQAMALVMSVLLVCCDSPLREGSPAIGLRLFGDPTPRGAGTAANGIAQRTPPRPVDGS